VLGWYSDGQVKYGIEIPHLLSLLSYHGWNAQVQGLDAVPADQRPPVNVVRLAFQTMVGIGTLLALLGVVYVVTWLRRKRLPESTWFYRALVVAAPLSVVALIAGWVVTEVGRQPWIVYHVMPTAAAVTGANGIPVGYATLAASYLVVGIGLAWVLWRLARRPLDPPAEPSPGLEPV
jgi:cytochrome bd ubiquinol oxidase subunit I